MGALLHSETLFSTNVSMSKPYDSEEMKTRPELTG